MRKQHGIYTEAKGDVSSKEGIEALFADIMAMKLPPSDLEQIFTDDAIDAEQILKNFEEFKANHPESILPPAEDMPVEAMSPSARKMYTAYLKTMKSPSKASTKRKIKEYDARMKAEKDPERIEIYKKAIEKMKASLGEDCEETDEAIKAPVGPEDRIFTPGDLKELYNLDSILRDKAILANSKAIKVPYEQYKKVVWAYLENPTSENEVALEKMHYGEKYGETSEVVAVEAKKDEKESEKKMKELAHDADLNYDGHNDNRLFYDKDHIGVFANIMTEKEYDKWEDDLAKFKIKGKGYEIYGWNDSSGYKYWKEEGENGDSNYVQITAAVSDPSKVDAKKLKHDMERAFDYFKGKYDNVDEYYANHTSAHAMKEDSEGKLKEIEAITQLIFDKPLPKHLELQADKVAEGLSDSETVKTSSGEVKVIASSEFYPDMNVISVDYYYYAPEAGLSQKDQDKIDKAVGKLMVDSEKELARFGRKAGVGFKVGTH